MASRTRQRKAKISAEVESVETSSPAEQEFEEGTGSAEQAAAEPQTPRKTELRPGQCRSYMRRELAREFEGIVRGFIQGAQSGSCQHVKLATEFLESRPRATRPKSGRRTVERWIDELERGV